MRVAVIGTGISGNAAAYALHTSGAAQIAVYERDCRVGGHSHTIDVDYDRTPISVDTGFIVYNDLNYPNLTALFAELGVATEPSDMSFALSADNGRFEWCGREDKVFTGLFAQPKNLVSPAFWAMLKELLRFQRIATADFAGDRIGEASLGAYLDRHGFSADFRSAYLVPIGAAIWSASQASILDFPARHFVAFLANHRLLQWRRPKWRTVTGGSRAYVDKITAPFRDRIRLGAGAVSVIRTKTGVDVVDSIGTRDRFDHVVIASHAPEALAMIADATPAETDVLKHFRTAPNAVYVHRDISLMPKRRAAWASWNVLSQGDSARQPVAVTYWMNRLQTIDERCPLFVSLNPPFAPAADKTFARMTYSHPCFDAAAIAAQERLPSIQGVNRTWFCGAWTGYGFHEDGILSGLRTAEALGGGVAWRASPVLARRAAE